MANFVDENAVIPPYPEKTPGFDNSTGTYWPSLSEKSKVAFDSVQKYVKENNVDLQSLAPYALDQRLTILRYLRANNFDVKKTTEHITKNIEWRKEMDIEELVKCRPEELLGCDMKELTVIFPHWQFGYDRTGRPVMYKQYGKFDATKIKTMMGGNYDNVVKYHIWEQEMTSKMFLEQTKKTGKLVETVTGIVDVKDMRISQVTRDFLALIRSSADIDQKQYPETLGRIYIINTPYVFPMVWAGVKPWLDPIVTSKIFVLGGPSEYLPIFNDFIGKENLPSNYGGDLPALETLDHPYTHVMRTFNAPTVEEHDHIAILTDKTIAEHQHHAIESESSVVESEVDQMVEEIKTVLKGTELDEDVTKKLLNTYLKESVDAEGATTTN